MQQHAVLAKIIKVYIILFSLSEIKQDFYIFAFTHFNNILPLIATSENCNPQRNLIVYDCNRDNELKLH